MYRVSCLLLVVVLSISLAEDRKAPGSFAVETQLLDLKDAKRSRRVPIKIYYPKSGAGPFPVILFSHGLGGSREGYEYAGRHWASHGYVVVHLQHLGSDEGVWKGKDNRMDGMRKAAKDPSQFTARNADIRFVLDELDHVSRDSKVLSGRLDLTKVGLAGHSFGARTTLTMIGQTYFGPFGNSMRFGDKRIKAAIAMSPSGQAGKIDHKKAFATVKVPVLHMTGTKDDGVGITDLSPSERRIPFDTIASGSQYLLLFEGGDHMIYSGRKRPGGANKDDAFFLDLIRTSSTAFWDAHLKGDAAARKWLEEVFTSTLGKVATFEMRK